MSGAHAKVAERPVVTGLGVVSCIGCDLETFWSGLMGGRSGVHPISSFDTGRFSTKVGCEIPDSTLPLGDVEFEHTARATRLALIAARQALISAQCLPDEVSCLLAGTTMGDLPAIEGRLPNPEAGLLMLTASRSNFAAGIARRLGMTSSATTVLTACAAGNVAIARAAELVENGVAERVLAGGAEAFSKLSFTGFSRMRAMAQERCTPFAKNRQGLLLGEGAAFLVIERLKTAVKRGVAPLAIVAGSGLTCDAYHITTPHGEGAARAMHDALTSATTGPECIDFICAHGTGTQHNDLAEAQACRAIFGTPTPPITSIKALVGHALGASSAIEAVACVLALLKQELPPQFNVDIQDPACDVVLTRPQNGPEGLNVRTVLNNGFAFGGVNSSVVFQSAS